MLMRLFSDDLQGKNITRPWLPGSSKHKNQRAPLYFIVLLILFQQAAYRGLFQIWARKWGKQLDKGLNVSLTVFKQAYNKCTWRGILYVLRHFVSKMVSKIQAFSADVTARRMSNSHQVISLETTYLFYFKSIIEFSTV